MSTTNHPDEPQSRLDREISEILEEARKRPISFQDRVAQKRAVVESQRRTTVSQARSVGAGPLRTAWSWAMRIPLVTALVVALIAVWVADDSQLIALLLGLVAAALIFMPFVRRRPSDELTYQKKWRGRPIDAPRTGGTGMEGTVRSWIDSAKSRFGR